MTALHVAASHPSTAGESQALVRALLDAGADADAADGEGLKAVHAAAAVGRIPVVEMLLKVTTPDEGVAASDWTASNVQKIVQAKLRAVGGGDGGGNGAGGKTADAAADEAPYEAKGVTDADAAATTKRAGDEAFIRGDNDAAVKAYDASIAADDTNAKVWANRAAAKLKLKNHVGARRDAKIARELDGTYVKAWYREGCALTEMGEYESAALAFFEGMQIDGDNKISNEDSTPPSPGEERRTSRRRGRRDEEPSPEVERWAGLVRHGVLETHRRPGRAGRDCTQPPAEALVFRSTR